MKRRIREEYLHLQIAMMLCQELDVGYAAVAPTLESETEVVSASLTLPDGWFFQSLQTLAETYLSATVDQLVRQIRSRSLPNPLPKGKENGVAVRVKREDMCHFHVEARLRKEAYATRR